MPGRTILNRLKRYRLHGDKDYEAVHRGSRKPDKCGQIPFLFVTGPWKDSVVLVEPYKMWVVK